MLSTNKIAEKYVAAVRVNEKQRRSAARRDCRELKRLTKGTGSTLEKLILDKKTHFHVTTVPPKEMERNENEIEQQVAYIRPLNNLQEPTKALLDKEYTDNHDDIYTTRRFLHCCRLIQHHHLRFKPFTTFYILELDIKPNDTTHPCGLTRGGLWKSKGNEALWKTPESKKVLTVIEVILGRNGNLSDTDSKIRIIREKGNMDAHVSVNLKRSLNAHSQRYNHGIFYVEDDSSDDESVGEEYNFADPNAFPTPSVTDASYALAEESEAVKEDIVNTAIEAEEGNALNMIIYFSHLENEFSRECSVTVWREALRKATQQWKSEATLTQNISRLVVYTAADKQTVRRMSNPKLNFEHDPLQNKYENDGSCLMYWTKRL